MEPHAFRRYVYLFLIFLIANVKNTMLCLDEYVFDFECIHIKINVFRENRDQKSHLDRKMVCEVNLNSAEKYWF